MMKATRAMYPESSSMESSRNSTTMIGMNESTEPTPPKMPSITSERTTALVPKETSEALTCVPSVSMPSWRRSERTLPTTENVSQNTSAMIATKTGMAVNLPVRTRSMATERRCSRLSWGLTTYFEQTVSIKEKRMSARAACASEPDSASI